MEIIIVCTFSRVFSVLLRKRSDRATTKFIQHMTIATVHFFGFGALMLEVQMIVAKHH
jgi:hypothetical protein